MTAEELRMEVARQQLPKFLLAARAGMHPARLGRLLKGRQELTPALAQRIGEALENERGKAQPAP